MACLQPRQLLLVLDNCAHLAEALRPRPKLRILATSREALASDGERVYRLPPLSLRNADDTEPIS